MEKYVAYAVYECPTSPTEYGKYIGKTPITKQAFRNMQMKKSAVSELKTE